MLEYTVSNAHISYVENTLSAYVKSLVKIIDQRFNDAAPVLSDMQVFNPTALPARESEEFSTYGKENIGILAGHYQVDKDKLFGKWHGFKYHLHTWRSACLKLIVRT